MKKKCFVVLQVLIFSSMFVFVSNTKTFAEVGGSVFSVSGTLPIAWQVPDGSAVAGIGVEINKIILPKEPQLMGVDFGASLHLPIVQMDKNGMSAYVAEHFPAFDLQTMFGILFVPAQTDKFYLGLGFATGLGFSYAQSAGSDIHSSKISIDISVGGEIRGGVILSDRTALTFGCTILYNFYSLDFGLREFAKSNAVIFLPSVGFGWRK